MCQRCGSKRVIGVSGKCSDSFSAMRHYDDGTFQEKIGYVPEDLGIGEDKYMDFDYCLDCGQIQGQFPLPETLLEKGERIHG